MGVRALIMIHPTSDIEVGKQTRACWDYIQNSKHLVFGGLLRGDSTVADAAAAVRAGDAGVIVAAYREPDMHLTGAIEAAGGQVEYAHEQAAGRMTVRSVIGNLHKRLGWSPKTIASAIGGSTVDVTDHLRRAGLWKGRRRE